MHNMGPLKSSLSFLHAAWIQVMSCVSTGGEVMTLKSSFLIMSCTREAASVQPAHQIGSTVVGMQLTGHTQGRRGMSTVNLGRGGAQYSACPLADVLLIYLCKHLVLLTLDRFLLTHPESS